MSKAYKYLLLFPVLVLILSCSSDSNDDPEPNPGESANAKVNKWIYEELSEIYWWSDYLPAQSSTNQKQNPKDYFYNTIWSNDPFSYIESTAKTRGDANGNIVDYGIYPMYWTNTSAWGAEAVVMQVIYVMPGSPADRAGIKRSDMFSHFNGTSITASNYKTVFDSSQMTLTQCDTKRTKIKDIDLTKTSYRDTPVICDTVYRMNDKNIGYLYYSKFFSAADDANDTDLRAAIARMKTEEISELILDLRFNGGGYLSICTELATMLAPTSYTSKDIFLYQEYKNQRIYEQKFSNLNEMYRLNLDHLHVIANGSTASASEILTYSLRQFMPVTHYGETTVGKNVGSYPITSDDASITWELHPISSRLYDKRGKGADNWQTFTGLKPDEFFDELNKNSEGNSRAYLAGTIGEYDIEKDYDPALNFVMAKLGYTTQASQGTRSANMLSATPIFPQDRQTLITD